MVSPKALSNYTIKDLNQSGTNVYFQPYAINSKGLVVGTLNNASNSYDLATYDQTTTTITTLGKLSGDTGAVPTSVNELGDIAAISINTAGPTAKALLVKAGSTVLQPLDPGNIAYFNSSFNPTVGGPFINNQGQVLVTRSDNTANSSNAGGVYTGQAFGALTIVPSIQSFSGTAVCVGQNDNGEIVGVSSVTSPQGPFALLGGKLKSLTAYSTVLAINNNSEILLQNTSTNTTFILRGNTVITVPGSFVAYGFTDTGLVVGQSSGAINIFQNGAVVPANITNIGDWTSLSVQGINNSGVIIGSGTRSDGKTHGFILTPQ